MLPPIALLVSYLAFHLLGYFGSFVPVLAGVFVHEMIEHYREFFTLRRENRELSLLIGHPSEKGQHKKR